MNSQDDFLLKGLIIGRYKSYDEEGSIHTYSKRIFVLSEESLSSLADVKNEDPDWGSCWCRSRYSAREDHGLVTKYRYVAAGLNLGMLLKKVGLTREEMEGNVVFSALNYKVVLDKPLSDRYYFNEENQEENVPTMLAMEASWVIGESTVVQNRTFAPYPHLLFGQNTWDEINRCLFVSDLRMIQSANQPPSLQIYLDGRIWSTPTLPDLLLLPQNRRIYSMNGENHVCIGVNLITLMERHGLKGKHDFIVKNDAGEKFSLTDIDKEKYLFAWYSYKESDGSTDINNTDIKLYSPGFIFDNIVSIDISSGKMEEYFLKRKEPCGTEQEILNSFFYCCVENENGIFYYYFTEEELRSSYTIHEAAYSYDDHTVAKTVYTRGVMIADLLDSLCNKSGKNLKLPDSWKVQYLEEDAYHTNVATYIDTIKDIHGRCSPILAFEKKECFDYPDSYHKNETAFCHITTPSIYRSAASANESVLKGVMGIIVGQEKKNIIPTGYYLCLFRAGASAETIISQRHIKGALEGMFIGIKAPDVVRFEPILPDRQLVKISEGVKIKFTYNEIPFVYIITVSSRRAFYVSDLDDKIRIIPESREFVENLALSGDAIILRDNIKTTSYPKRNLYVDKRLSAEDTLPFGYDNLILRRYEGWFLKDFLDALSVGGKIKCLYDSKKQSLQVPENQSDCFIAFRHSQSKGVPQNTAVYKRLFTEYDHPKLISFYNGRILTEDIAEIEIDE